jgi:hypothetical protein
MPGKNEFFFEILNIFPHLPKSFPETGEIFSGTSVEMFTRKG